MDIKLIEKIQEDIFTKASREDKAQRAQEQQKRFDVLVKAILTKQAKAREFLKLKASNNYLFGTDVSNTALQKLILDTMADLNPAFANGVVNSLEGSSSNDLYCAFPSGFKCFAGFDAHVPPKDKKDDRYTSLVKQKRDDLLEEELSKTATVQLEISYLTRPSGRRLERKFKFDYDVVGPYQLKFIHDQWTDRMKKDLDKVLASTKPTDLKVPAPIDYKTYLQSSPVNIYCSMCRDVIPQDTKYALFADYSSYNQQGKSSVCQKCMNNLMGLFNAPTQVASNG